MKTTKYALAVALVLIALVAPSAVRANTIIVSNANDSGAGSLRAAIAVANARLPGPNVIDFNISGAGPFDIILTSGIFTITNSLTIDGTTQPGFTGTPLIEIDTSGLPTPGIAFNVASGVSLELKGISIIPSNVPEPSSLLLIGTGLLGLLPLAARSKRHAPSTSC